MFNFHKPRVYRSTEGCCICRAKSSSSRFTDSHKYKQESMQCFNLKYPRHGEICNACVLLVKRYKRLPVGSKRHWGHVVDARAGPGTKSLAKQKKREDWGAIESNGNNSKTFIPEKYAKIFKKKRNSKVNTNIALRTITTKTKPTNAECSDNQSDSNESYDEQTESSITQTPAMVVQFQTQTRAAAQKKQLEDAAAAAATTQTYVSTLRPHLTGSKRRHMLPPKKNRNSNVALHDSIPFFEQSDLVKVDICCGVVYQYTPIADCLVLDADEYIPCEKHRKKSDEPVISSSLDLQNNSTSSQAAITTLPIIMPKPTVATMPAIMRLEPTALSSNMVLSATNNKNPVAGIPPTTIVKSTPVLKKHHLFFKRQSENFPKADNNQTSQIPASKTECILPTSLTLAAVTTLSATPPTLATQLVLQPKESIPADPYDAGYMPRHINSKAAAITTKQSTVNNIVAITSAADVANAKSSSHTRNLALVLKPTLATSSNCDAIITQQKSPNPLETTQEMTTALGASSPSALSTSSSCSSSSTATKFNDNSSDSGFDEHVQERKSASPPSLQDEQDKKPPQQQQQPLRSGQGLQRLILASGVQIMGQPQNVMLAGNEFAARLLQRHNARGAKPLANGVATYHQHQHQQQQQQQHQKNQQSTSSSSSGSGGNVAADCRSSSVISGNSNRANRAIYNNSNTIQHENGVTTILPASSLAASNQTVAMNTIAPSTVTIRPALLSAVANVNGGSEVAAKKISLTGGHAQPTTTMALNNATTNQKKVIVKAATALASQSSASRQPAAANHFKN